MAAKPIKIRSLPGVKRDGTRLEGDYYVDAQWTRFQRGLPRKMGGYLSVARDLPELVYGIHSFSANAQQYFHLGSASQLAQRVLNSMGAVTADNDRTPAGLVASAANIWQFDAIWNTATSSTVLVAHAAENVDISNQTNANIWYGDITGGGILADTGRDQVSGGVIVVGNYLVSFGNGGFVGWGKENAVIPPEAGGNFTQQKIIVGKRIRGSGVPSALLWSLDSLLQMTFQGVDGGDFPLWDFDTITDDTSILSSRGVVEYDGIFYWPGVDRFLMYNGVVREIANNLNVNYFFDNLNFQQRQKVYAYKVPRYGEIWWCFPFGDATECTHAVVYNVRENSWYDTVLPDGGRTDGIYAKVYNKPFMTGVDEGPDGFDLWQHETGYNRVRLASTQPIPAHFETHEFSVVGSDESAENKQLRIERMEPDFVQAGNLQLTVRGRANSRSTVYDSEVFTIPETAANAGQQTVPLKENRRLMSFKFSTNELDGNFQMGETFGHVEPTDSRVTQ
jgi:hypothetical protein